MIQLSTVCGASTINNKIMFLDGHDIHFNDLDLSYMEDRNIQPFALKSGDSGNDQPNENGPNVKLKSRYNDAKVSWMLNYGMEKFLPRRMNSILVEAWGAFKVSTEKIIRDSFVKKKLPPLSPANFTTNTQACVASAQVSSGAKAEDINGIERHTVAPIEV